jgi:hypothetical protein
MKGKCSIFGMTEDGILKKEFETKQRTPKRKKEGRT